MEAARTATATRINVSRQQRVREIPHFPDLRLLFEISLAVLLLHAAIFVYCCWPWDLNLLLPKQVLLKG
jgi:hypothetical protein